MAVLLGLCVAVVYGTADFLGGRTSRAVPAALVVAGSQLTGLALVVVLVVVDGAPPATLRSLAFGAASGVVGLIGARLLYRGLAVGAMGVIAPVTAVGAAVVPVTYGIATGERPSGPALVGIALALVAVALIAGGVAPTEPGRPHGPGHGRTSPRELLLAGLAGGAFGVGFILLAEAGEGSGFWPVLAARAASTPVALLALGAAGHGFAVPLGSRLAVAAAGALDAAAIALYLLASRQGLLSLVAVLGSLYPAATVLLARVVLHERFVRTQLLGLLGALVAVVLIAG